MPGGWPRNHGSYIGAINKPLIEWPVKNENKLVFRMITGDTLKSFLYKITHPFQVIG